MPAFSRSSSSFIFVLLGTCALLVLIVVLLTGGFVFDAGPFHFSARRWPGPVFVTLAAWGIAGLHGRASLLDAAASMSAKLNRYAVSAGLLLACSAAGVGIGLGTFSASGSDAAGYVSQADLLLSGRLIREEPLVRLVAWPDATRAFSPLGYRPGPTPGEIVPSYPPGLPLTMAAVRVIGGELAPFLVAPLLGALAVLFTYALGAILHSRTAGVVAAALLATSPIFLFQIVQPMTDVPVTGLFVLATWVALSPVRASALAAGAASGFALLMRPNLMPVAVVVALISVLRSTAPSDSRTARAVAFVAGIVPALGALGLVQFRLYGQPFGSGYGSLSEIFVLSNIAPNVLAYAARLVTGEGPALALMAASLVVLAATRSREADAAPRMIPAAGVAALFAAALLACYLPYGVFAEWSYLRFLLPAFPLAFVVVGGLLANAVARLPLPVRALAVLIAITVVGAVNINNARREQAFNLRRYEARYRDAGRYLESALPPEAVVFTVQESASVHHYARVPIVRWDLLSVDLDAAITTLQKLGRVPVLLVEDWETADIQKRFPGSAIARLDWPWRAEFGDETRVRLFDPTDRGATAGRVVTDRLH